MYSAIYYAEMSMSNIIGNGTFFEDAAKDSHINTTLHLEYCHTLKSTKHVEWCRLGFNS